MDRARVHADPQHAACRTSRPAPCAGPRRALPRTPARRAKLARRHAMRARHQDAARRFAAPFRHGTALAIVGSRSQGEQRVPIRRPPHVPIHITLALAALLAVPPFATGASARDAAPPAAASARRPEARPARQVRLTLRIGPRCTETTASVRVRRSALVYP
jgi:hypothetical protein